MEKLYDQASAANFQTPPDSENMARFVLNPSHYAPIQCVEDLECTTRDLCFALHNRRSVALGYPS